MRGVEYTDYRRSSPSNKKSKAERFNEELETLKNKGVYFTKHSDFHIKVSDVNYYSSGAVNFDGECRLQYKGLDFFLHVLDQEGYISKDSEEALFDLGK